MRILTWIVYLMGSIKRQALMDKLLKAQDVMYFTSRNKNLYVDIYWK